MRIKPLFLFNFEIAKKLSFTVILVIALSSCGRNSNDYDYDAPYIPPFTSDSSREGTEQPDIPIAPPTPPTSIQGTSYKIYSTAEYTQNQTQRPIDILFSIENSNSMRPYIEKLRDGIQLFIESLKKRKANFRIGLIKSNEIDSRGRHDSRLIYPYRYIDSSDSDATLKTKLNLQALLNSYPGGNELPVSILLSAVADERNGDFFRPNGYRFYFVLSDSADNASVNIDSAINSLGNDGNSPFMLSAIASLNSRCNEEFYEDQVALKRLVALSNGRLFNICDSEYDSALSTSTDQIIALIRSFSIAGQLRFAGKNTEVIRVHSLTERRSIPNDSEEGFVFNNGSQSITFPGSYLPASGSRFKVEAIQHVP